MQGMSDLHEAIFRENVKIAHEAIFREDLVSVVSDLSKGIFHIAHRRLACKA